MMKNNNKKKGNTAKKLLPAAMMLAVSASMLGTSTYAWFTMNKTVTVEGMEVRTKVGSNLLIAPENYVLATTGDNAEENYVSGLVQTRQCLLEPSSTNNGVNYYYTVEAKGDGNKADGASWIAYAEDEAPAVANSTAGKENYDKEFNIAYTTGTSSGFTAENINLVKGTRDGAAYGYIDYAFYIKATPDSISDTLIMTKCNLLHNGAVLGTSDVGGASISDKAWRVAVFKQAATAATDVTTAVTASDLVTILAPNAAQYQTSNSGVTGATAVSALAKKGVSDAAPDTAVDKAVISSSMTAGATEYYKVTVRLWLEGEDKTCTSDTYAKLTTDYALDLEFKLEADDTNAVYKIGSTARDQSGSYVVSKSGEITTTTKGGAAATIPSSGYTYKIGGVTKTYDEVTTAIGALADGQSITVVVEPTA